MDMTTFVKEERERWHSDPIARLLLYVEFVAFISITLVAIRKLSSKVL